jgi:sortase A
MNPLVLILRVQTIKPVDGRGTFFTKFTNSRSNCDLAPRVLNCFEEFRGGPRIAVRQEVVSWVERRLMARLERICFKTGFALLATWGAATLHGIVFSRMALAEFHAIQATRAGSSSQVQHSPASSSEVDFASWSIKRVQAYRDSFLEKVDAPLAVLRIPKIHLEVPVFNGTDNTTLNRGVGRIVGSAQVGASGNLGLAGHRDGFFRGLKNVAQGDVIELARSGQTDFYVIDGIQIVNPKDVSVLDRTPTPSLTLVTCFPFYFVGSAPQRYIVRASLKSSSASREGAITDSISTSNKTNTKENER